MKAVCNDGKSIAFAQIDVGLLSHNISHYVTLAEFLHLSKAVSSTAKRAKSTYL